MLRRGQAGSGDRSYALYINVLAGKNALTALLRLQWVRAEVAKSATVDPHSCLLGPPIGPQHPRLSRPTPSIPGTIQPRVLCRMSDLQVLLAGMWRAKLGCASHRARPGNSVGTASIQRNYGVWVALTFVLHERRTACATIADHT
jgi:hypothetical protein